MTPKVSSVHKITREDVNGIWKYLMSLKILLKGEKSILFLLIFSYWRNICIEIKYFLHFSTRVLKICVWPDSLKKMHGLHKKKQLCNDFFNKRELNFLNFPLLPRLERLRGGLASRHTTRPLSLLPYFIHPKLTSEKWKGERSSFIPSFKMIMFIRVVRVLSKLYQTFRPIYGFYCKKWVGGLRAENQLR